MAFDHVDPHFHAWDVSDPEAGHDGELLGGPASLHPVFSPELLGADLATVPGLNLVSAVHIEAIAKDGLCR